jgi:protein-disulfide isomerase
MDGQAPSYTPHGERKQIESHHVKSKDSFEIPVGKWLNNPWFFTTVILAVVLGFMYFNDGGSVNAGNVVTSDQAANSVISFLNSNPSLSGGVSLVSVEETGSFYQVTVSYEGQPIPVYVTKDGNYLLGGEPVPLTEDGFFDDIPSNIEPIEVSADDDAVLGDVNAPVEIIEFSDYQCPFCSRFWADTLPLVKENYIDTGKVKLIFRDFPLSNIHPEAQIAAEASECVRSFGGDDAFWDFHDTMFENQRDLSEDKLVEWATEAGFDIQECLDNGDFRQEVLDDFADGNLAGVTGTPSFVINGVPVSGAIPYDQFAALIDSALAEVA